MILILVFLLGLAVGSFLSATAWRLRQQETSKTKKTKQKYSVSKGRSMCEHCGHTLAAKDLIPVVSWVSLGGKCRYCKHELSWEYPLSEIVTGLLYTASYLAWDFIDNYDWFTFTAWLIILSLLVLLAIYDIKWMLLPNKLVYPLIFIAVILTVIQGLIEGSEAIKNSVLGLLFIGGTFYLLFQLSKGRWIGGGDVKLGIFIGIFLGLSRSMLTFILAFNIAALIILPLLLVGVVKRKTPIPFGPFLIAAMVMSTLYGYEIIEWYSNTFLNGLI